MATENGLLLDTHVWLWWLLRPERLRPPVRERIADPNTPVFLSTLSSWELTVKVAAGKLQLAQSLGGVCFTPLLCQAT